MNWHQRLHDTTGRNVRRLKSSRMVWALAVVLLCAHAATLLAGWNREDAEPWQVWGLSREGIRQGRVWQFVSYALLHGSWFHLAVNLLFLLLVGSRVEHITGGRVVAVAVLAGAVLGGTAHVLLGTGILVGISGGALALWMLLIGLSPESRMLPFPGPCIWLGWGVLLASLVLALCDPNGGFGPFRELGDALEIRFGSWLFAIGHACHFGGGLAGWLVGLWILRPRITLEALQKERARRENRRAREE